MKNIFKFLCVKNNKKLNFLVLIIFVLFVTFSIFTGKLLLQDKKDENVDISVILEKAEYSYLPVEAKNYIKIVYEETGQVLFTEKNREANRPYLNPKYVEYLSLDYEKRKGIEVIPAETIIDYIYNENNVTLEESQIPASYDLRDIDGNKYVTPVKNQGKLPLSWAFATTAQVESYLLATSSQTYEEGISETFSERQIDYATSNNGILGRNSDFYFERELGSNGNFRNSSYALISGLSLFDSSWKEYIDTDFEKMNYYEVINFKDSKYELNSTIEMPYLNLKELDLTKNEDVLVRNNYLNTIKENVMNYGGAIVSTKSPEGSCSFTDSNNNYFIYDNNKCDSNNYALQIIGWDDNYEYEFCSSGESGHNNNIINCENNNIIKGKGAWLLKRSINSEDDKTYGYLAYDSYNLEYNIISNLTKKTEKTWDNIYIYPTNNDKKYEDEYGHFYYTYETPIRFSDYISEEVVKLKFFASSQNTKYRVYTADRYDDWKLAETIEVQLPGLYNIDLSRYKYKFNWDNKFYLKIIDEDGNSVLNPILYTKNLQNEPAIGESYYDYYNSLDTNTDEYYEIKMGNATRNIDSYEEVDYILYDYDGNNISSKMTYSNNVVADNYVYTTFRFDSDLEVENSDVYAPYIIKVIYKDELLGEIILSIKDKVNVIEGNGTVDNPYVITNSYELNMINDDLNAHYVLGNDINFTRDNYYVIINGVFKGTLDGQGYSINGLPDYYEDFMYMGLFEKIGVGYEHDTIIKNINFSNINLWNDGIKKFTGILADNVTDCSNDLYCDSDKKVIISNISIQNSDVEGGLSSGGLIGGIQVYKKNGVEINQAYINASVYGVNTSGGVVGKIEAVNNNHDASVSFSNIHSSGEIDFSNQDFDKDIDTNYYGSNFIGSVGVNVNAENILLTGSVYTSNKDIFNYGTLFGNVSKNGDNDIKLNINNVVYYSDYELISNSYDNFELTGINKKSFDEIKSYDTYTNWNSFKDIWTIETINGISRFPILKFMQDKFDYINVTDIESLYKEKVNLYDYVNYIDSSLILDPELNCYYNLTRKIIFTLDDSNLADIDNISGTIYGKQVGYYNINIKSNYDGFEKSVPLNISDEGLLYTITFHSNNGKDEVFERAVYNEDSYIGYEDLFTKVGYEFYKWNTDPEGKGKNYNYYNYISKLSIDTDIDLYAVWEKNLYSVIFVNTKGTSENKYQFMYYDEEEQLDLNTFAFDNYRFMGWNTSKNGTGTSYQDGEYVKNLSSKYSDDVYLYTMWEEFKHKIKYMANDGTDYYIISDKPYNDFRKLEINLFERDGYFFDSWNTEPDGSGIKYDKNTIHKDLVYSENNELTLYAQWRAKQHEIIFNSNGGTGIMPNLSFGEYDSKSITLNKFTNTGYVFAGWNTNKDGTGDKYIDGQVITINDDITLYAQWEPITYKITFYSNGGTGKMETKTLTYGQWIKLDNQFEREGYKFKEFNTDYNGLKVGYKDNQTIGNLTTEDGEFIVLYAIWEPITYTIEFDSNGGTGVKESKSLNYDRSFLLINNFEREGYEFKEWNTKADGQGIGYKDNAVIKNLTTKEEKITLYAIWKIKFNYEFNDYELDDDGNLTKIKPLTTVDNYLKNIKINNKYSVKVFDSLGKELNGNNLIFTGSTTKIYLNNEIVKTFVNIIPGDVDGNGQIQLSDIMKIANYIYKDRNSLVGVFALAADFDNSGLPDLRDIMKSAKVVY